MSTATATTPTPLWAGEKLPVVGVTGEYGCGKSTFLLSIDPDCYGLSRPPRTIAWDTELGLECFEKIFSFEHKSLTEVTVRPGYKPEHLYLEWLNQMRAIQPGQYRVAVIDTVSEIENGLADWVHRNPEHFGHTSNQYAKMEQLFWVDVKTLWQQHLSECAQRVECLGFCSHTKDVWEKVHGEVRKTGEKTAKGKQTLWQLASLYLWLDRTAKPGSKRGPRKPSGTIFQGKMRLICRDPKTGELEPILPPRLPEATPDAIRHYIKHPADYNNLKAGERAVGDEPMTDDEKLLVNAAIARDQAAASQAELGRVEMMRQAAQVQGAAMAGAAPAAQPVKPQAPPPASENEKPVYSASTQAPGSIAPEQGEKIVKLFGVLGIDVPTGRDIIVRRGFARLAEMSFQAAAELEAKLEMKATEAGAPF